MHIQWFPGHMTKAIRMMTDQIKLVDCVVYVLDARAVFACINPSFNDVIGSKPILYVINKSDLIEKPDLKKIEAYFEANGYKYISTVSTANQNGDRVVKALQELMRDKIERYRDKGVRKTVRAMVLGVPNSGKSTLINCISKKKKAVTGNKPGVTRGKQWVNVSDNLELLDTPGTLCPQFENQELAMDLAFIGSISEDILDTNELALCLLGKLSVIAPSQLMDRYKLAEIKATPLEIYEDIAYSRGYILRGNNVDYDRAALAILDDFRKQKIGKIALELPNA